MSPLSPHLLFHLTSKPLQLHLPTPVRAFVSSSPPLLLRRIHQLNISSPRSKPLAISSASSTTTTISTSEDSDALATSTQPSSGWAEFAARVSGEWDGFGANFTTAGEPVELPDNVVPEAYREWGVQVWDWQTQCPTLAVHDTTDLHYKLIRLLPTVGCEADAATIHTAQERHAASASAFAYSPAGSYIAAWPAKPAVTELEHCIVHPKNREVRIRVVQLVAVAEDAVRLRAIKVFSEQWYGPFRNGEQLGGCAVRESGFATGESLNASEVLGQWASEHVSVARFADSETDKLVELSSDEPRKLFRDETGIVTLPKQLWSLLKENGGGGGDEFLCEVGWLLDHGNAVTSRCVVSKDGRVKEMAVAYESLVSKSA